MTKRTENRRPNTYYDYWLVRPVFLQNMDDALKDMLRRLHAEMVEYGVASGDAWHDAQLRSTMVGGLPPIKPVEKPDHWAKRRKELRK